MKVFLVTGAAGFIGSHTVEELVQLGHHVVGLDDLSSGRLENLAALAQNPRFLFIKGDVTNEELVERVFAQHTFDAVLHLAALVSVPRSFEEVGLNYRVNLQSAERIGRLAVNHRVPRVVLASSAAIYGNATHLPVPEDLDPKPQSPYACTKLAAEIMLHGYGASFGLEVVCFRYFNVYGVRQDPRSPYSGVISIFLDRLGKGLPITVFGDGEQTRDFISVSDVSRANCAALVSQRISGGSYNLCTGQGTSINTVLSILGSQFVHNSPIAYANARLGDIRHSIGCPDNARKVLNFATETSIQQGLTTLANASQGG